MKGGGPSDIKIVGLHNGNFKRFKIFFKNQRLAGFFFRYVTVILSLYFVSFWRGDRMKLKRRNIMHRQNGKNLSQSIPYGYGLDYFRYLNYLLTG